MLFDRVVDTDLFVFTLCQELLEQGSSQPWDDSELIALREQVKKLSSEKAALQEKNKELSKGKKG
jgi:hypothetical protein